MKTVEIAYRYEALAAPRRPRPQDSDAALLRLKEGNRRFAELLAGMNGEGSLVRQAPSDLADFVELGDAIVRSRRIASFLSAAGWRARGRGLGIQRCHRSQH
jgi:hypothetical protein